VYEGGKMVDTNIPNWDGQRLAFLIPREMIFLLVCALGKQRDPEVELSALIAVSNFNQYTCYIEIST
jgi:hypothetical protein